MKRLNVVLILIFIQFIWCKSQEDKQGFYSGILHIPEFNQDIFVSFDNGISVFLNHSKDSLDFKFKRSEIHFPPINYWGVDYKIHVSIDEGFNVYMLPKSKYLNYSLAKIVGYDDILESFEFFNLK